MATKTAKPDDIDDSSAPLISHLAELRKRLIWSVLAFVIAMVLCYFVWNPIFDFLTQPICYALEKRGQTCGLILLKLQEGFFVAMRIAFFGGFVLAFPVVGYQLWRFVAPGLYRSEKNALLPFLIASPVMFIIGAGFAYYIILPWAFDFFLGFQQGPLGLPSDAAGTATHAVGTAAPAAGHATPAAPNQPWAGIVFQGSVEEYLTLTTKFILAFGLSFQLPVALTLMGKAGLVSAEGLASVRRYAIIVILVLAAMVTPPDVISQIVLFSVIYGLYEISIILVRRIERKRALEEQNADE
ncbi:twin-arginine translocase subunit TatC [Paracoccus shanxieyensis]|uniref:Sec-independent protein translocase protein TatC n=1 Tax=Paracoccus shanxieyensis TaxID=2675752 RepID=A0A6L6IZU9_9RHOB|nr:twin-arginine translocase subunit TatC [Paracoccus shanxieyensis]MTH88252.1 twin-arginine translocase subunit TatC [Paracoccus shanxieyensis]